VPRPRCKQAIGPVGPAILGYGSVSFGD
jgi:hypothetical protein